MPPTGLPRTINALSSSSPVKRTICDINSAPANALCF
ncbi:leuL [Salmonella enterica subsp. enterica serovar Heidelberg str. B182]|nr:leuL [Salmonella enterica subsp. enterica serovar Heidelberg str. B182]